jgi:predicted NBD/HSP70 family sugar kinase
MNIGVDIGDAGVLVAAVDDAGRVSERAAADGDVDVVAAAVAAVDRMRAARTDCFVGVATTEFHSPAVSRFIASLTLRRPDLVAHHAIVGRGTAAAIAESWIGAARGVASVVYFGVDAHASAGVVRDGRPVVGAHGYEPAVGWLALNPVEREDYRKSGCLEAEVAAAGIVRRLIWRVKAGDRSRVADAVNGDLSAITYNAVVDAARAKDGVSISVMRDTAKYLGMAAANLVIMADPSMLVLGGIMASASDLLLEPILWELGRRLPGAMMDPLKIGTAAIGNDAVVIGAARAASIPTAASA